MENSTFSRFLDQYVSYIQTASVIIEIGSDRYEGSTILLDSMAKKFGVKLISVDIIDEAKTRLENAVTNTEFVISSGSQWTQQYDGPPISLLYLDNFDYIYDSGADHDVYLQRQIDMYKFKGIQMSNNNCQIEHLTQMLNLYPHVTSDATIIFDDTYQYNDCWIGKCGAAVVFLQSRGWTVAEHTTDCGVVMKRS